MTAENRTFVREDCIIATALDQELIVLDVEKGKYLTINAVGADIWRLLVDPISFEALVSTLAERYDGPHEQISRDALVFLDKLVSRGLVRVVAT